MIGFKKKKTEKKATESVLGVQSKKGGSRRRKKAFEIRLQKDVEELDDRWANNFHFVDPDRMDHFTLSLYPDEGIWKGVKHDFDVTVPQEYPIKPPKVRCLTKVYHPNIDQDGAVCLNILRADWKPVLTLNAIFTGLHFLFLEPNPNDPLDKDAAKVFEEDYDKFKRIATNYTKGNYSTY